MKFEFDKDWIFKSYNPRNWKENIIPISEAIKKMPLDSKLYVNSYLNHSVSAHYIITTNNKLLDCYVSIDNGPYEYAPYKFGIGVDKKDTVLINNYVLTAERDNVGNLTVYDKDGNVINEKNKKELAWGFKKRSLELCIVKNTMVIIYKAILCGIISLYGRMVGLIMITSYMKQ